MPSRAPSGPSRLHLRPVSFEHQSRDLRRGGRRERCPTLAVRRFPCPLCAASVSVRVSRASVQAGTEARLLVSSRAELAASASMTGREILQGRTVRGSPARSMTAAVRGSDARRCSSSRVSDCRGVEETSNVSHEGSMRSAIGEKGGPLDVASCQVLQIR